MSKLLLKHHQIGQDLQSVWKNIETKVITYRCNNRRTKVERDMETMILLRIYLISSEEKCCESVAEPPISAN